MFATGGASPEESSAAVPVIANTRLPVLSAAGELGVPPNTSVAKPGLVNPLTGLLAPPSNSLKEAIAQLVSPASISKPFTL